MSLATVSIRRPVLSIVLSIVIILFGAIGFSQLGIREYPAVDPPIVTVSTSYAGANADVIESQITEPLEASINGISGVRTITSTSRDSRSQITVEFNIDQDLEAAANDVRDRVSRAVRNLPPDADPPTVAKADADQNPILFITVESAARTPLEISGIVSNVFKERLQTVAGVSEINIWGEKKYAMRLSLDPARLAAYGLTPQDIRAAITAENVELPSGKVEGSTMELSVRTQGRIETPEQFNNLILRSTDGKNVRLRDVGYAELSAENIRTSLRRNGVPLVGIAVFPQPGANNVAIADEVYKRLDHIKADVPADIQVGIGFDTTQYIRQSINEVVETIAIAFGLVAIIIFLFLRDWRTTIIPVLAIPVSLIGTFFIMSVAGFSINVLTMLGIVLAIGLVVDDAIVVLENIYAKIEQGMPPMQAGIAGAKEIFLAVIATTVSLAAVFMPLLFLQGLTGRLFTEFGVVIAGSVIISAFVALTLTPMLSTRIIKSGAHNRFYRATEPFFQKLTTGYRTSLETFMRHRWLAVPIILAVAGIIWWLGSGLKSELAPLEDRSRMRITATAQEGATYTYMEGYMKELEKLIADSIPERAAAITVTSPGFIGSNNTGFVNLILTSPDQRKRTQQQVSDFLGRALSTLSGARAFASQEATIGDRRAGLPVQFVIQAPTLQKLREALPKFLEEARKDPTFRFVDVNLKFNKPELRIEINREKARSLGVSVMEVAQTLQLALSEQRIGYFIKQGKQYQVIGELTPESRMKPLDLRSLSVRSSRGQLIQLDNLVTMTEQSSPPQLFRYNRYVSATVSADPVAGKTIADGIEAMRAIAARTLDASFSTDLAGSSRDFADSSSTILFAFLLALVLVYLTLAAQFESFRDPFIILLTVPLALAGAVISLWYFGQTLNIFSQIGVIMLVGLVTKNGILIVEFANQRKEDGLAVMDAIIDASAARFRPILMTSFSTILGTLPIALALGGGAESRVSMGIAVVGGLILSGFLTLYVIPAMYSYLTRKQVQPHLRDDTRDDTSDNAPTNATLLPHNGAAAIPHPGLATMREGN